jgi:ABC-type amino acid transport substrate-binding protein
MFSSARAQQILDSGVIRVGARNGSLPPFMLVEGGYSGFEVEVVEAMVDWLFAGAVEIEWIGIGSGERFSALNEGQFDLLARTVVHTQSRNEIASWTKPYFLGGLRMVVRQGEGIASFDDLEGKRVSILGGTTIEELVRALAGSKDMEIVEVINDSNDAALAAFTDGDADAYVYDWAFLLSRFGDDPTYEIVGGLLTIQPFAMGVALGEDDFVEDLNQALQAIVEDGTYDSIYDQWFAGASRPWSSEEMLNQPPADG